MYPVTLAQYHSDQHTLAAAKSSQMQNYGAVSVIQVRYKGMYDL